MRAPGLRAIYPLEHERTCPMKPESDDELKILIDKAAAILRAYGAREVYAFGSAQTGDFDAERSDIDLAVRGIPPGNFYSAVGEALCSIDRDIDVIDLDAGTAFGKYLEEHRELTRVL
jgi:predicted nucleotidyltransferase